MIHVTYMCIIDNVFIQYRYRYCVCIPYIYLYNTDICITCVCHISICTIQLYMIHVTSMYIMCLYNTDIHWSENRIHQTLPSVISPCSHINTKLLVFWVWVPTIQNTLCLYYMLEVKGNMYQCGGYFMPLFCIFLYSYI